MNKLFICICLLISGLLVTNQLRAQTEQISADSALRKLMKDSLSLNDTVITQVLTIRNHFLTESERIAGSSTYTEEQRESLMATLVYQTNENIRNVLGAVVYGKYTDMIKRRIKNRNVGNQTQPLATQTENN